MNEDGNFRRNSRAVLAFTLVTGFILGAAQVLTTPLDPFDAVWRLALWTGGGFLVTLAVALRYPQGVWRWGAAFAVGILGASLLRFVGLALTNEIVAERLPLFTSILWVPTVPPAFAGAYAGKLLRWAGARWMRPAQENS